MTIYSQGEPHNQLDPQTVLRAFEMLTLKIAEGDNLQPGRMTLLGWDLEYPILPVLATFVDYILFRRINDFLPDNDEPVILDCGANIGYTVLNYKRQFPKAHITAFEPDPDILPYLHINLERNGADDVEVVEAAAWISDGQAAWYRQGIDGSRIIQGSVDGDKIITVPTVELSKYLDRDVDLLKVDIESAEFSLIPHLGQKLKKVKNVLVECHITDQKKYSQFAELVKVLAKQGFNLSLNSYSPWRDLIRQHRPAPSHSEQYILVCGWRTTSSFVSAEPTVMPYFGAPVALELLKKTDLEEERVILKEDQEALARLVARYFLHLSIQADRLTAPFSPVGGNCWSCDLPSVQAPGDTVEATRISPLLLFEDDHLLGPAHSVHDDIRLKGGGRYSHWHSGLYFSTPDGSNPNENGRNYTVVVNGSQRDTLDFLEKIAE